MNSPARFTVRHGHFLLLPLLLAAFLVGCGAPNDPDTPGGSTIYQVLGTYTTRANPNDVAVHGDQLIVAENLNGLTLYDVSDRANIQLVYRRSTTQPPRFVRVAPWNDLLIVGFQAGIRGYQLNDTLGELDLSFGSSSVWDAAVFPDTSTERSSADGQFYHTNGTRVLRCDLNDGLHGTFVYPDSLPTPSDTYKFWYRDPFEIAFLGSGVRGITSVDGFHTVAVSARDLGVAVAELDDQVAQGAGRWLSDVDTPGDATELVHQNGYIYVADGVGGLAVLDVQNPSNIEFVTSWKLKGLDHANDVAVDEHRLALVDQFDGVYFLDITNPREPVYVGSFEVREPTTARFLENGDLVIASKTEGLTILNLLY